MTPRSQSRPLVVRVMKKTVPTANNPSVNRTPTLTSATRRRRVMLESVADRESHRQPLEEVCRARWNERGRTLRARVEPPKRNFNRNRRLAWCGNAHQGRHTRLGVYRRRVVRRTRPGLPRVIPRVDLNWPDGREHADSKSRRHLHPLQVELARPRLAGPHLSRVHEWDVLEQLRKK